ncbi:MAG: PCRF domain-containing protein, partial [Bacteroidales bacterium]|nr:PCRF domain-containing protein [Bacteroidales bacterium]
MDTIFEKLQVIHNRWIEIGEKITDPDIISNMKLYVKLNKDYKDLIPVVDAYKEYKNIIGNIKNAKEVLATEKDEEFREMAKSELDELIERKDALDEEIRLLLLPSDPQDGKNAIIEIRAGTGGDEASIFAGDLFRMYVHFCETKNWKIDIASQTEG